MSTTTSFTEGERWAEDTLREARRPEATALLLAQVADVGMRQATEGLGSEGFSWAECDRWAGVAAVAKQVLRRAEG